MEFHERIFGKLEKKNPFWAWDWNPLSFLRLYCVSRQDLDLVSDKETQFKDGSDSKVGTELFCELLYSLYKTFLLDSYALWKNLREQKNEEAYESS